MFIVHSAQQMSSAQQISKYIFEKPKQRLDKSLPSCSILKECLRVKQRKKQTFPPFLTCARKVKLFSAEELVIFLPRDLSWRLYNTLQSYWRHPQFCLPVPLNTLEFLWQSCSPPTPQPRISGEFLLGIPNTLAKLVDKNISQIQKHFFSCHYISIVRHFTSTCFKYNFLRHPTRCLYTCEEVVLVLAQGFSFLWKQKNL